MITHQNYNCSNHTFGVTVISNFIGGHLEFWATKRFLQKMDKVVHLDLLFQTSINMISGGQPFTARRSRVFTWPLR